METINVVHQPLRWVVTNGRYVVLLTYDKRFAEKILKNLKAQTDPHNHWIKIGS